MQIYYWENPVGKKPDHGRLVAEDDTEALRKTPKTAICAYKESESENGLPLVMIYKADT